MWSVLQDEPLKSAAKKQKISTPAKAAKPAPSKSAAPAKKPTPKKAATRPAAKGKKPKQVIESGSEEDESSGSEEAYSAVRSCNV